MHYALIPRNPNAPADYRMDIEHPNTTMTSYHYRDHKLFIHDMVVLLHAMETDSADVSKVLHCASNVVTYSLVPEMEHSVSAIRIQHFYFNMEWEKNQQEYPYQVWVMDMSN